MDENQPMNKPKQLVKGKHQQTQVSKVERDSLQRPERERVRYGWCCYSRLLYPDKLSFLHEG